MWIVLHFGSSFKCIRLGIAVRGKSSMNWFFGFKLYLICNEKGELLNFMFPPDDMDDRFLLYDKSFIDQIIGKQVGDKGYISKNLFEKLFVDGIQLITKLKKQYGRSHHESIR